MLDCSSMSLCVFRKAYMISGVSACSKNAVPFNTAIQYFKYVCEVNYNCTLATQDETRMF